MADGAIGEIWLRSAAPKRLYLDETLNAQRSADGWTRTRDLGYVGADGDLYLFDRAVDAIHTNGRLVSSIEVEGALYAHPCFRPVTHELVDGFHRVGLRVMTPHTNDPLEARSFAALGVDVIASDDPRVLRQLDNAA